MDTDEGGPTKAPIAARVPAAVWTTTLRGALRRHLADVGILALTVLFALVVAAAGITALHGG